MEKQSFINIVDALVELNRISDGIDQVLEQDIEIGMDQIMTIVYALEYEFEDTERWISWWIFDAGINKEVILQGTSYKLPTAGDLYDLLNWNNANS